MHVHQQVSAAAYAALNGLAEFSGRGSQFRMRPAEREVLPLWSVYVAKARNQIVHQHDGVSAALERDIELALVLWLPVGTDVVGLASTMQALAETRLANDAALKVMASRGLIYPQSSDLQPDRDERGFAVMTLIFRMRVVTPLDDSETILT